MARFTLGGMLFEYDSEKIGKILRNMEYLLRVPHVCSLIMTTLNFTMEPSGWKDRYDAIGDTSTGNLTVIGNLQDTHRVDDTLFVVYTERAIIDENEQSVEVIRLISARLATNFERGVYYGKCG